MPGWGVNVGRRGVWCLLLVLLLWGQSASAADTAPPGSDAPSSNFGRGDYWHFYGATSIGRGLRFNNPYRLQTQLGDDAQSLSATAPYLDLAVGALFGRPLGLQHGAGLNASFALSGVRQEVLTPAYLAWLALAPRWHARLRAGIPIVVEPDASAGLELGLGAAFLFSAGLGVTAEMIGSLYPGAATAEQTQTLIPVVSLQLGILIDYEVLP